MPVRAVLFAALAMTQAASAGPLRVASFDVDASPPLGSPLAYDINDEVLIPLSCRGVVLLGDGEPVVLCAVDWIGIGNEGHRLFRESLAAAAGTRPERVAVHALHQHDAPVCDLSAERLLEAAGVRGHPFDGGFARDVIRRAAEAVKQAAGKSRPVTHLGLGSAEVREVASNRRILGPDGKVKATRYTATRDPAVRAEPVGTIDPELKMLSFWDGDRAVAVLTYYATHPQSYYRTGKANPDFPGIARNDRQRDSGVFHVHFNGAGGNVGAGKWNDGSPENREILAGRVADGMRRALEATRRVPLTGADLKWDTAEVNLPPAEHLNEAALLARLRDADATPAEKASAARGLVWLRRCKAGDPITLACLNLGPARVLHMPGELFVEYQLAAAAMRPDLFVATAAYGDYAPGYIGTEVAYGQGGYETSARASRVAPGVEAVLTAGTRRLLGAAGPDDPTGVSP